MHAERTKSRTFGFHSGLIQQVHVLLARDSPPKGARGPTRRGRNQFLNPEGQGGPRTLDEKLRREFREFAPNSRNSRQGVSFGVNLRQIDDAISASCEEGRSCPCFSRASECRQSVSQCFLKLLEMMGFE